MRTADRKVGGRRLWALVSNLPPESATARATGASWSQQDELLAALVDSIAVQTHVLMLLQGVKSPPAPVRVPRPYDDEDDSEAAPVADIAHYRRVMGGM